MSNSKINNMVFFGTPLIAVFVLEELEKKGIVPSLIVTSPDKPRGRKMLVTPSEVKVWGDVHNVPVLQPEKLTPEFMEVLKKKTPNKDGWDVFVVVAYGKILPESLLEIPKYEVLNMHPSLLPRLRGANPIREAILKDEKEVGVSIMLVDKDIDHGPILAQERVAVPQWPPRASELEERLARHGGEMLSLILPKWINGEIIPQEQNHKDATYTKKITKGDGLIDLNDDPYQNLLKIRAYEGWPGTYFFIQKNGKKIRVKIIDAEIQDEKLKITRVIPEGKKEVDYEVFLFS